MMKKDKLAYENEYLKQFIQLINGKEALDRIMFEINKNIDDKKIIKHESEDDYKKTLLENIK